MTIGLTLVGCTIMSRAGGVVVRQTPHATQRGSIDRAAAAAAAAARLGVRRVGLGSGRERGRHVGGVARQHARVGDRGAPEQRHHRAPERDGHRAQQKRYVAAAGARRDRKDGGRRGRDDVGEREAAEVGAEHESGGRSGHARRAEHVRR